jgi:hypothetical protein
LESVDWIEVAQNMDRWRAVVNAVLNIEAQQNAEEFAIIVCRNFCLPVSYPKM